MSKAWSDVKLGEVCRVMPGYAFKSGDWRREGIPVVKIKNITSRNTVDLAGVDCVPASLLSDKMEKFLLNTGDILVAMTGATVGKVGKVRTNTPVLLNQRVAKIEPVRADAGFIWAVVSSDAYQKVFFQLADGAAQPNMSGGQIAGVTIPLPPLPIQRRIAGILSAYDDLIENCERRIRVLDEMARALYREWFVLFRYPGHEKTPLVDSPLGRIPKGWTIANAGTVALETRRGVPKGVLESGPVRYVGLEHIPRRTLALDAWEETADLGSNKLRFERGEILFGKIRPYFHKVSVAPFAGVCSADTFVISPTQPALSAFTVCLVSSDEFVAHASATANGAKMPRASWDVMMDFPVVVPPPSLLATFSAIVDPLVQDQGSLVLQAMNLRKTRDLLLPRLLSGQLSVDDAA